MRSSAKWALLGVGLLALSALAVGVVLVLVIGGSAVPRRSVLVIRASGPMIDHDWRSPLEQLLGGELHTLPDVVEALERAADDRRVRAVVLKVGSVDAGWGRTDELRAALERFGASGKPVIAHLETGGSKEYYLACAADRLYLQPTGVLTAGGLLADAAFFRGTLDKLKILPEMEQIGAYKSAPEQWTRSSMSEAQREAVNSIMDSRYELLLEGIAKARGIPLTRLQGAIDSGILAGAEAKSLGLVDELLYEDEVEARLEADLGTFTRIGVDAYKKRRSFSWARNRIAVIFASGAIVSGKSGTGAFGEAFIGSESLAKTLREVREDAGIRAAILRIDSPGGSGIAADAIWRETIRLKEEKPLVVSMGDVAASGGYYIAMSADSIVASPWTITGSIGVFGGKFNLRGFYEDWLGLRRVQIKRGENADLFTDYQGFTQAQRAAVRAEMQAFYEGFVRKVSEGRGKDPEEVERVAQGRIWTGVQGAEIGLVDELGGLQRAVEIAREKAGIPPSERVTLESFPRRRGLIESLLWREEEWSAASSIPEPLRTVLADLETRERVARDGLVLWTTAP